MQKIIIFSHYQKEWREIPPKEIFRINTIIPSARTTTSISLSSLFSLMWLATREPATSLTVAAHTAISATVYNHFTIKKMPSCPWICNKRHHQMRCTDCCTKFIPQNKNKNYRNDTATPHIWKPLSKPTIGSRIAKVYVFYL